MSYIINVAKRERKPSWDGGKATYRHFFATAEHSCQNGFEGKLVYDEICAKFPAPEYEVTVTQGQAYGTKVDFDKEAG